MRLADDEIREAVQRALAEDLGSGDVTTLATLPPSLEAAGAVVARAALVVAGLPLAEAAFRELAPAVACVRRAEEGQRLAAGQTLLEVAGPAHALLAAERVALNFLQRLCGIATLTAQFVAAVAGTPAIILDTRKTTPGWRRLEKYAVACGGGRNHRFGLFDMVLIKDNHLAALGSTEADPIGLAVRRARAAYPQLRVEVEVETRDQLRQALAAGADLILLDNMALEDLRWSVGQARGRAQTEASGGVTLATVRTIAETGVDFISVGALTHSARAADIGLDFTTGRAAGSLPHPAP